MKTWMIALNLAAVSIAAAAGAAQVPLKDADGKTLGVGVLCNQCAEPGKDGKKCHEGAVEGYLDGKPCGDCLLKSNWGVMIRHPRDLIITGRLMLADGKPAKKHYVKLFMPNGWGSRTQASEEGRFRMRMGATAEREKGEPLVLDIGEHVDFLHKGNDQFTIYLMPEPFAPCDPAAAKK